MDTSDQEISFDDHGVCNHCHEYDEAKKKYEFPDREMELQKVIAKIKEAGKDILQNNMDFGYWQFMLIVDGTVRLRLVIYKNYVPD